MTRTRDRTYRGIFRAKAGDLIGLDFYGENLTLARAHACHVAADFAPTTYGPMTLLTVITIPADEFKHGRAGTWFPVDDTDTHREGEPTQ